MAKHQITEQSKYSLEDKQPLIIELQNLDPDQVICLKNFIQMLQIAVDSLYDSQIKAHQQQLADINFQNLPL
jgi:hypothetical protein